MPGGQRSLGELFFTGLAVAVQTGHAHAFIDHEGANFLPPGVVGVHHGAGDFGLLCKEVVGLAGVVADVIEFLVVDQAILCAAHSKARLTRLLIVLGSVWSDFVTPAADMIEKLAIGPRRAGILEQGQHASAVNALGGFATCQLDQGG